MSPKLVAAPSPTCSLLYSSGGSSNWIVDTNLVDGDGNLDQDPLYITQVILGEIPLTAGDLPLTNGSPAVDAGENLLVDLGVSPIDFDWDPRIRDGDSKSLVNIGAYEAQTNFKLMVSTVGVGSGVVTSDPAWINCGSVCEVVLQPGGALTLDAASDTGSQFDGWSGDCSGTGGCDVNLIASKYVTAAFSLARYNLMANLTGSGGGTITSQPIGINCGVACSE